MCLRPYISSATICCMDDHCHLREEGIKKLLTQIEAMVERLSTHSTRYMGLTKKLHEDHFDNMLEGLKLVTTLSCNPETKEKASELLDNLRAWNLVMDQMSEALVDISQDLVGVFDATASWAATEGERERLKREAMENVEELESV